LGMLQSLRLLALCICLLTI